jgi:hypothetical protein
MRFIVFLYLSFLIFNLTAQEKHFNAFSVSLDARKIDYFFRIESHFKVQKINVALGIEFGIVKTLFQQRFFPGVHGQISYPLLKTAHFSLAPAIELNYNVLTVQKSAKHPNVFQEYRLGYQLTWGKTFKLIHSAGIGMIAEQYYGAYSQKYITAVGLGYSVKIGCFYAF